MIDRNSELYADYIGAGRLRLGPANLSLAENSSIVDIGHMVADRKFNKGYDLRSRSHVNLLQAMFVGSPDYFFESTSSFYSEQYTTKG